MSSRMRSVFPSVKTMSGRAVETDKRTGMVVWGFSLARWPRRSAKMAVFSETCLLIENLREFNTES